MNLLKELSIIGFNENEQLADPDLLLHYKNIQDRDFWLEDDVEWDTCQFIIKYIRYLNKHSLDKTTPITIHLFTNGGDLAAMWSLISAIEDSKIPVHTINEGICHSAGFSIFLAGSKRIMRRSAFFIAHEGSAQMGGNFRETKQAMAHYEKMIDNLTNYLSERMSLSIEEIKEKFDQNSDWYITEDDALEYGVITEK